MLKGDLLSQILIPGFVLLSFFALFIFVNYCDRFIRVRRGRFEGANDCLNARRIHSVQ